MDQNKTWRQEEEKVQRIESEEDRIEMISEKDLTAIFQSFEEEREYTVYAPEALKSGHYVGKLYGCFIQKTRSYNIIPDTLRESSKEVICLGYITEGNQETGEDRKDGREYLKGKWESGELKFSVEETEITHVEYYSLKKNILSRNQGVLESDVMKKMHVILAGVGSGGSEIGLALVRSGVGEVTLCDDDIFEYPNICRHQCGILDVGKYKVDAVGDRMLQINPDLVLHKFTEQIQKIYSGNLEKLITQNTIILCCTDNRHAGYVCNTIAKKFEIPMVAAGCGARASSGEVFYWKPGLACYACAFGEDKGVDYSGQAFRRNYYIDEAELEKADFQPGLAVDISLVSLFVTKLTIDLLMEKEKGYVPRLLGNLKQYTMIFNYLVDEEINPFMQYFDRPMSWKTGRVERSENCPLCKTWKTETNTLK